MELCVSKIIISLLLTSAFCAPSVIYEPHNMINIFEVRLILWIVRDAEAPLQHPCSRRSFCLGIHIIIIIILGGLLSASSD